MQSSWGCLSDSISGKDTPGLVFDRICGEEFLLFDPRQTKAGFTLVDFIVTVNVSGAEEAWLSEPWFLFIYFVVHTLDCFVL